MHCKLKKDDIKQIDQRRPKSKIMNSRLVHLQGVGYKIVNRTHVAKTNQKIFLPSRTCYTQRHFSFYNGCLKSRIFIPTIKTLEDLETSINVDIIGTDPAQCLQCF